MEEFTKAYSKQSEEYHRDLISGNFYKTHRTIEAVLISNRLTINEALEVLESRGFKPFIIEPTQNWWRFYQYQPSDGPHIKRYWIDVNRDVKYIKVLYRKLF